MPFRDLAPARARHPWAVRPMLAALAATALAATVVGAAPAAAAGAGLINPWSLQNEQGGYDVSRTQALKDAASANLITAHRYAYAGDVPAMKRVNPRLLVLGYVNATFAQSAEGTAFPDGWYAKDSSGTKVRNRSTGNYMMDPGNDGWVTSRINECKSRVSTLGYDGCDLDVLGLAPLSQGFVTSAALNPRTGAPWTKTDWINATAGLAGRVSATMRAMGKTTMGNGLSTGAYYFDRANPTRRLLDAMDGAIAEAWLRGAQVGVNTYRDEAAWKKDVDMIVDAEARGKPLLALTKMWVKTATQAQKDSWRTYSLASFLLGSGGLSYFYFSDAYNASRTAGHPWYTTDLGNPIGPYAKTNNVYQRSFDKGRVLVNPSSTSATVSLGAGTYRMIDGRSAAGSVTLPPNGSAILVHT